jgi:hypothetical protein
MLNRMRNGIEDNRLYPSSDKGSRGTTIMDQAASILAAATMAVAAGAFAIAPAQSIGLQRTRQAAHGGASFARRAFAPIETMVDWLEAAYGGPISADESR